LHGCILATTDQFIDYYASFFICRRIRNTLTQGDNMNKLSNRADAALDYLLCLVIGCGLAAALVAWWSA
jgi:hypothetical protein